MSYRHNFIQRRAILFVLLACLLPSSFGLVPTSGLYQANLALVFRSCSRAYLKFDGVNVQGALLATPPNVKAVFNGTCENNVCTKFNLLANEPATTYPALNYQAQMLFQALPSLTLTATGVSLPPQSIIRISRFSGQFTKVNMCEVCPGFSASGDLSFLVPPFRTSSTIPSEMLDALTTEVIQNKVDAPASAFIQGIVDTGDVGSQTVDPSQLDVLLTTGDWQALPDEVKNEFKAILFTTSIEFQSFSFSIQSSDNAQYEEYVGCGRNHNNVLELAYIHAVSKGTLITQYDTVPVRTCHHCGLFRHCCNTQNQQHPRGFNTNEIASIQQALRASVYQYLTSSLSASKSVAPFAFTSLMYNSFVSMPRTSSVTANAFPEARNTVASLPETLVLSNVIPSFEDRIKNVVSGILSRIADKKKAMDDREQTVSEVVRMIVKRGFATFEESAMIEVLQGVTDGRMASLKQWISTVASLPDTMLHTLDYIYTTVAHSSGEEWIGFHLVYPGNGQTSESSYSLILARFDVVTQSTEWLIGTMRAQFTLAPNLIVVHESHSSLFGMFKSSHDVVLETPPAITASDIQQVLDFFFVVMIERSSEVLNIKLPVASAIPVHVMSLVGDGPSGEPVAPPVPVPGLATASAVVTTVTSWWTSIAKAFKTTKTTQIVGRIQQEGFNKFSGSALLDHVEDLEDSYVDSYLDILVAELNVPDDQRALIKSKLSLATHLGHEDMLVFDITFSINNGGECRYACVCVTHDKVKQTTSVMSANIQASFALAPNILIVQKTQSKLGGIYESSSQNIEYQNRPIEKADVQAVFQFFQVVAFDQFAKLVNIPVNVPTDFANPSAAATSRSLR